MTIKQLGGVFGRNPTFNDVTIDGELILNGEIFTGLDFQGSWNASTNTPTLASGVGTTGEFYIVSVAGTTNLDGITNWGVGDWAMFSGSAWQRVEGNADGNFVNLSVSNEAIFSGNVGIGTSSPNYPLHVKGTTNILKLETSSDGRTQLGGYDSSDNTNFLIGSTDSTNAEFWNYKNGYLRFATNSTERMRIDSSGNVGIGTASPSAFGALAVKSTGTQIALTATTGPATMLFDENGADRFFIKSLSGSDGLAFVDADGSTERMRIDASGNLLVGKTSTGAATAGIELNGANDVLRIARDGGVLQELNRITSDGDIIDFRKDNVSVGSIGVVNTNNIRIGGVVADHAGLQFGTNILIPETAGTASDGLVDIGTGANRYQDVYATNGTIQTSDGNEKQDIEALSDAEQRVAVAAKGLLRKFRWKSSVAEKGDEARTHFGIIAQDLQAAFAAEGLDAGDYGMFINSTWTDEETGEERSRMGVRYSELLAFIISAI